MKPKYPNKLAEVMAGAGVGPTELARNADTSKQNVSRHMKGDRELTPTWARKYAPSLGVDPSVLISLASPKAASPRPRGKAVEIPLLASVPAGRAWAAEGVTLANVRKTLLVGGLLPTGGDWIALEVEGDSMDRVAPPGSIILIDRADKRLLRDRFYVFSNEAGEATFKRYRPNPERLVPFSTNSDHETILLDDDVMFTVGRVRRTILDL